MTAGGEYVTEFEASSVKAVGVNQGHATIHASAPCHQPWSLTTSSVESLQNPHTMVYGSTIGFHSDQQITTNISRAAPDGTNTHLYAPATSSTTPSQQEYSDYTSNPYSTISYGYGSSDYQNQHYGLQQPANDSSHQQSGAGQNTCAPYQSLTSFQNASPYVGSTSYSSTYYNPADYQTASGYQLAPAPTPVPAAPPPPPPPPPLPPPPPPPPQPSQPPAYQNRSYNNQSSLWNGGNGSGPTYNYSNYTPLDTNQHNTSTAAGNPLHYQQQHGQWLGYYSQPTSNEVLCAPGTENLSVTNNHITVKNQTQITSSGYPYANNQPPPPGITQWKQDFTPSVLPASQGKIGEVGYNPSCGWKAGEDAYQNQHDNQTTSYFKTPLNSNHFSHARSEDQKKALYSQRSILQFPLTNQVSQNFQMPIQTVQDSYQTNRMQIPTNPRIAKKLAVDGQKTDNESIRSGATLNPAYTSVSASKLHVKEAAHDSGDNFDKGTLPSSLRAYVERTFARCKNDSQRTMNQNIMKEMITKTSADGTLLTRNWDIEPLFPLTRTSGNSDNNMQNFSSISFLAKHRNSPNRRIKSRWEPLLEEKLAEGLESAHHIHIKDVALDESKDNKKVVNNPAFGGKYNCWNKMKFVPAQQHSLSSSNTIRPPKRQRFGDFNPDDASSDSDKEQSLTKYYSSAMTLDNSPEERRKREHRGRRFEKGQNHQSESKGFKTKGAGTLYTRRTKVMLLAKNYENNANRVVEDIDWDSLTIKGACQEIEKCYLRLTSAPNPATVRPEDVLEKALLMVQSSQKNYIYKCDQLKSIRQDLTVQRIWNELTVKVYESHARLALEAGDLAEYNQCQSQLKTLYSHGIQGCHLEFSAYNLLRVILQSSNNRELLSSMARLSTTEKEDGAVKHALAVRAAITSGNYILFFRLYRRTPNLNMCIMNLYVEKMRFEAARCICKSYRPSIPIAYIAQILGFTKMDLVEDSEDTHGLEECADWLRAHGAILTTDNNSEMQLDTKTSSSTLYKPEPEDAVCHGDASLMIDDFLTRT